MRHPTVLALGLVLAGCLDEAPEAYQTEAQAVLVPVNSPFTIQTASHKCVDVGGDAWQRAGAPVFIYACNGTSAQRLQVVEVLDGSHDVVLKTSTGKCIGVRGNWVAVGRPLELQDCSSGDVGYQRFALDGDAILLGAQTAGPVSRHYVVEVKRGRGLDRAPLEVGTREVDPAEYFTFQPLGARVFPTDGFVRVNNFAELTAALANQHWGTVIDVAPGASIGLPDLELRYLEAGVTLRSSRRGMTDGALIYRDILDVSYGMFQANGPHVRITGLRFRGPSGTHQPCLMNGNTCVPVPRSTGLGVSEDWPALIDHNELSQFTQESIVTWGAIVGTSAECLSPLPSVLPSRVRIIGNYIHDNARQGGGYGVNHGPGSNSLILGNTFSRNRHAIASGHHGQTNYTATHNLVMPEAYRYGWAYWWEHDFDVHGSADPGHWEGGRAGNHYDIGFNTFLGDRKNIHIRGTPCDIAAVHHNVFVQDFSDAVEEIADAPHFVHYSNDEDRENVMGSPGQGDFDGDGTLDDFVGTGTAWYYRPGKTKEWRFLAPHPERTWQVQLADLDGDGRTDARIARANGVNETSWGAASPWDRSSAGDTSLIGRDGQGYVALWTLDAGAVVRTTYPRVMTADWQVRGAGDFNGDGHGDLVWRNKSGQTTIWSMIDGQIVGDRSPGTADPTWTVEGVGDFDGDGAADLLRRNVDGYLQLWFKGDAALASYPGYSGQLQAVDPVWQVQGVGDFSGDRRADILWRNASTGQVAIWTMSGGTRIGEIVPGGTDPAQVWKIQGVADLDGNERADILWRDTAGKLRIWFNGQASETYPSWQNAGGTVDASWRIIGVGDIDHDRRADILWRHIGGQVSVWLMRGATYVGDVAPTVGNSAWTTHGLVYDVDP